MKSSKVCNFFFKELESCFASKRDKERQSSPWHHSRRESLSTKKKNHPNLCKAPIFEIQKPKPSRWIWQYSNFHKPKKERKGIKLEKHHHMISHQNWMMSYFQKKNCFSLSLWPPKNQQKLVSNSPTKTASSFQATTTTHKPSLHKQHIHTHKHLLVKDFG